MCGLSPRPNPNRAPVRGIRLDQTRTSDNFQYPTILTTTDTAQDTRLYDPSVVVNGVVQGNQRFNNRFPEQYLLYEDYDADNRDDTPPDFHRGGLGCIDCHGGRDLHGGTAGDPTRKIVSRGSGTASGESCHGNVEEYETKPCNDYNGNPRECVIDRFGNPLRHDIHILRGTLLISRLVDTIL